MDNLQSLMAHIAKVWVCDSERYPALTGMNDEQKRNFLVKHSLLHIGKTTSKVAAVCEAFDHNGKSTGQDREILQVASVKMFVNALKLAEEAELSASDLLAKAPGYVK